MWRSEVNFAEEALPFNKDGIEVGGLAQQEPLSTGSSHQPPTKGFKTNILQLGDTALGGSVRCHVIVGKPLGDKQASSHCSPLKILVLTQKG